MMLMRFARFAAPLFLACFVHAQTCSNTTTVGRYVIVCEGFMTPAPNTAMAPAKILGTATADSSGNFKAVGTVSIAGMIVTQKATGTQKLNKDCTGTITYSQTINGQPGPPLNITYVVSQQGQRIDGLSTDMGTVLSCVLKRVSNEEPGS
jgi:hypothetical protein